ncbi:hypothetical protein LNKW23_17650 [Paralimibaculum aggregatum]|uniref:Uncharacterized protein n=1 Tax=Paralimibaculum aggregatum TaxID=3036245 RepID=A0ABQ6LLL4_9RHOB|nr:hypothetical protein [Limibaculum sp. NKW23]GMG82552.1 hypothetical protein LNKW23_17650 [Limibaculum sp. NKW23]
MTKEIDLNALFSARRWAKRRTPAGERMVRFRWAEEHGAVWVFSAGLVSWQGLASRAAESRWQVPKMPAPVPFSFWLATAARQDVWRSLKGVPTLMPVIRVTSDAEARSVSVMLGAVMDPKRASPAIEGVLEDMFQPRRINAWTEWAVRNCRAQRRGPAPAPAPAASKG